ncbi:MAG: ADP-forming succinate--CoA ligase subunit beta [Candidatus Asgardarchaeia archaeon]
MRLYEYESKELFKKEKIPVPNGTVVKSVDEALKVAKNIGYPVVVKAQVLVGGRGKAGGVKIAENPENLEKIAEQILSMRIKGEKVSSLLIEQKLEISQELYLSIFLDRSRGCPLIIMSELGGVDIEEVATKNPEKIVKRYVNPLIGLKNYHILDILSKINVSESVKKQIRDIIIKLWKIFSNNDAELVEINPLVITDDAKVVAADAKILLDENALFKHPDFLALLETRKGEYSQRELEAMNYGMSYVELDGTIGIIGNGAGLVMSTMDVVKYYGGDPANFLDVGGGASAERMFKALKIVSSNPNVRVIFINILGGITRCDEMAQGIIQAIQELRLNTPLVIRLVGTNEEEGRNHLQEHGIHAFDNMESAAKKAVEISKEGA